MSTNELSCKTGLMPNVISEEVFSRELLLCGKLFRKNGGKCGWGICKDCGVIPFLYKLYKGQLLEDPQDILNAKNAVLK